MFNDPMYVVALLLSVALLLHVILFGRITKQDKARNKFLADELNYLQKRRQTEKRLLTDTENDRAEWEKRYTECFQHLREDQEKITELQRSLADSETRESNWREGYQTAMPKIAELEKELEQTIESKKRRTRSAAEHAKERRTAWAVHQVVTVYGKPRIVCLSAVVFAENGMKAKAAFFDVTKEAKRYLKIRTVSPIQANKVFPNI